MCTLHLQEVVAWRYGYFLWLIISPTKSRHDFQTWIVSLLHLVNHIWCAKQGVVDHRKMPCISICNGDFDPVTLLVKEKGLCDRTLVCLSKDQVSRKARSSNQASFKGRIKRSRPYFRLDCRRRWKYRSHYDDYPLLNNIRLIPRGLQVALWRHCNSVIRHFRVNFRS